MRISLPIAAIIIAALVLWLASDSFYVVSETQEALLVRQGFPIGTFSEPGLKIKIPFLDSVISFEKRVLTLEPATEQVILGDQKRIQVDTYTVYRIIDPLKYYQSLRTVEEGRLQLAQIVSSAVRRELGQIKLPALLSDERSKVTDDIRAEVVQKTAGLGVEVLDVRLHRADLPEDTSQSIYDRMKSERQREAKELRAQGYEWAQEIQSKADRDRTVLLSEATRQARVARGEGDAEANQLFINAFGSDPEFFTMYRTLQTYRQALAAASPTLLLSSDSQFLKFLFLGPPSAMPSAQQQP
ncbi:MAG: protease modulator HflC [Methylobacteriaceae bacterium]|nr:protease modulator HflC [Methylobacteriaceae bacterium]